MRTMPRAFPSAARAQPPRAKSGFRLLRYFAIASFIAILLAAIGIGVFFRQTALKQLVTLGEDNNVALAHALSATLRPHYAPLIAAGAARSESLTARLHEA